jgi:transcriptional regulator with XRE-family HTH domain
MAEGKMVTIRYIRESIFRLNQHDFAEVAQVTQATVSRWDSGRHSPHLSTLERVRAAALARGLKWDDSWFFELPKETPAP